MKEYEITATLPRDGERVLCYGFKTVCCEMDMDDEREWHEVTFNLVISEYKLKEYIPPLEESIIEYATLTDIWNFDEMQHVIGVTHWRTI